MTENQSFKNASRFCCAVPTSITNRLYARSYLFAAAVSLGTLLAALPAHSVSAQTRNGFRDFHDMASAGATQISPIDRSPARHLGNNVVVAFPTNGLGSK